MTIEFKKKYLYKKDMASGPSSIRYHSDSLKPEIEEAIQKEENIIAWGHNYNTISLTILNKNADVYSTGKGILSQEERQGIADIIGVELQYLNFRITYDDKMYYGGPNIKEYKRRYFDGLELKPKIIDAIKKEPRIVDFKVEEYTVLLTIFSDMELTKKEQEEMASRIGIDLEYLLFIYTKIYRPYCLLETDYIPSGSL